VLTTSGRGTTTDPNGHYEIEVNERDSIWFSYLNKPTIKFPVLKMRDITQFDISLQVSVQVLKEVRIRPRDYHLDSIQNRRDYERVFDFQKPSLGTMTSIGPTGAGIDLDELIRAFQFRKNKNMLAFQRRLVEQERDKFIDHRFNKLLVRRLTQLNGSDLDVYMRIYRPSYEFTLYTSDYDFQDYIRKTSKKFKGE
jgi:plasmid maintenance system killer protein